MRGQPLLWRPGEPVEPLRQLLARGGILAFPTESSYGFGVDPRNPRGVEGVYRLKGRDAGKALPVVAAEIGDLECLGIDPGLEALERLARVWPAPLTAVLPLLRELPASTTGGLAVRIPAHEGLRALLREVGPLTATSANPSGEAPARTAGEARDLLRGWDAAVMDGPPLPGGPPSTLIRWDGDGWEVLREGAFPKSELERLR